MSKFDAKAKIIKMQGKDYLPVNWRIVWFREDHPKGAIVTEVAGDGLIKATIIDGDNKILATGHGTPKMQGVAKSRPFEGAETAAIGRALAHAGYGTQFTDEDEGEHLADSPVEIQSVQPAKFDPLDVKAVEYAAKEWNISPDETRSQIVEVLKTKTFTTKDEFKAFVKG